MVEPQLGPTKKEVIYGYFVIHILGILKKSFTAGKIAFVLNWAVCGVEYT